MTYPKPFSNFRRNSSDSSGNIEPEITRPNIDANGNVNDDFRTDTDKINSRMVSVQLQPRENQENEDKQKIEENSKRSLKHPSDLDNSNDMILSSEDLKAAFTKARKLYDELERSPLPGSDPDFQESVKKCIVFLDICERGIRRMQVFSKNEICEDVNTDDLPYLLINYLIGKLYFRIAPSDSTGSQRLRVIELVRIFLEKYLEICLEKDLMDEVDKTCLKRFQSKSPPKPLAREVKMERFSLARSKRNQLDKILKNIEYSKSAQKEIYDDSIRERYILELECAMKDSFDELESVIKEEEILLYMTKMNLKFSSPDTLPPKASLKGLSVTHVGKDMSISRETIKAGVFGMSWAQPTMTLEEIAEIEMNQAMEKEKREREYRLENPEVLDSMQMNEQGLENDNEVADKAAKKDRDWDDWKDDNPKGHGVTKRF